MPPKPVAAPVNVPAAPPAILANPQVEEEALKTFEPAAASTAIISPAVLAEPAPTAITEAAEAATPAAAEPVATTIEPAKKEVTTMATQFENMTTKPAAMFGDINDRAKTAMEKSTKMVEEMTDFAKGNVEAMVEASRIATRGFETLGQEAAEYGRKSFENTTAAMKSFASVKSPTEFFKLQSDFMRQSFDMAVAEASKNTETMLKLAGDAAQPLSNRVAVAAEKVKVAA
jgi:phasin family protein